MRRTRKRSGRNDATCKTRMRLSPISRPYWSDMSFHRNIGHVQYTAAITVDVEGDTRYTSDWAAFLAAEAKVKDQFEGNVVDLGAFRLIFFIFSSSNENNLIQDPSILFKNLQSCSVVRRRSSFLRRESSGLRWATKEDLANPAEFDSEGQRCLIVGQDGNTTDLPVGRYAGLMSFTLNAVGIDSVELGIYNSGVESAEAFSAKGDSGSLVWHTRDGRARIVGQLLSGSNRGSSTTTSAAPPGQLENNIVGSYYEFVASGIVASSSSSDILILCVLHISFFTRMFLPIPACITGRKKSLHKPHSLTNEYCLVNPCAISELKFDA